MASSPFSMITIPTIHLNGTGADTLMREYRAAYDAIGKAIDALASTTCNGRDFYVQGGSAYYKARDERQAALDKLRDAQAYCGEICQGIEEQQARR